MPDIDTLLAFQTDSFQGGSFQEFVLAEVFEAKPELDRPTHIRLPPRVWVPGLDVIEIVYGTARAEIPGFDAKAQGIVRKAARGSVAAFYGEGLRIGALGSVTATADGTLVRAAGLAGFEASGVGTVTAVARGRGAAGSEEYEATACGAVDRLSNLRRRDEEMWLWID